jgi:hypothetical protein
MNRELRDQLIQVTALANRNDYDLATDYLLNAVAVPVTPVMPERTSANVSGPDNPVVSLEHQHLVRAFKTLFNGNKITMIKAFRELTYCGLKEAKDWVETYITEDAYRPRY